ncbi:peptide ABC transporter substrate-binding protein [Gudongella oleilytica]|uniref:peptide ABC transporter substrate-binding protein n=1 Tax=Gudongella oleilytica TaxID=1582259 RepID=UPI002A361F96|nr:peptide ABC transporter substrate-binding protein [Gudongella oleilytica]MDY0257732.1 peptide ABC transporter substrate-binding protein [Gudongella oleilytica]
MNKRLLALMLVLTMAISLLAGCAQPAPAPAPAPEQPAEQPAEPAKEVVFNWNIGADPKTIDPVLNGASDGGDVINQTFEGLTREKSGTVYPGIAESWDVSEDGLTVTFHLRESKWSDGSPLTAHDFVYSWKRGMDPATASEYAWIWEYTNIVGAFDAVNGASLDEVGVTALDDYTLEVKLITPTDYIISLLSFYHFMPTKQSAVEAGADGAWAKDPANAVSNGPFKLTSYKIGEGLTLVKNEHYWNAAEVKIDRIEGKFIDEQATAYQAYQAGELHLLPDVPPAEIPTLIAESPDFYVFPLLGTYYYNINMDLPMFQDVRVRKALNLAIDRELITETMGSGQIPAAGFVPPGFLDHEGNDFFEKSGTYGIATDNSKVAEAQALLAEAGFPGGAGFPEFTIMYNTGAGHQQVAELVQEMYKTNLGINVKLENQEWAVFQDTKKEGDYEVARGGWLTDFMDPMGLLAIFTSQNAYNDPNFNNAEYDELLSKAAKTRGAEHFEALYEAQEILMSELPIIPVYHYTDVILASPKLQGWDRSVLGTLDFSTATIVE